MVEVVPGPRETENEREAVENASLQVPAPLTATSSNNQGDIEMGVVGRPEGQNLGDGRIGRAPAVPAVESGAGPRFLVVAKEALRPHRPNLHATEAPQPPPANPTFYIHRRAGTAFKIKKCIAIVSAVIFSLAFLCAWHSITLLTGNAVHRINYHKGYNDNAHAAAVGAVGGLFGLVAAAVLLVPFLLCGRKKVYEYHAVYLILLFFFSGPLSGAIGAAILQNSEFGQNGRIPVTVVYGVVAGFEGSLVLCLPGYFVVPFLLMLLLTVWTWGDEVERRP